jgi:EAL domain-containing protein (putative c-di-GMP-specific phosphodiesterase class I)
MSKTDVSVLSVFAEQVRRHLEPLNDEHRARKQVRETVRAVLANGGPAMAMQPIVRIASMEVTGYEALARFPGPPRWTPDRWFRHAEQVGLGATLEAAAVHAALQHVSCLPPGMSLNINVSARALLASRAIQNMLGDACHDARLVLELTEHESITQPEELCEALAGLRMAGVRIAVDDVGSGYAGLERIVSIGPEVLKLDRGLVDGVADHPGRRAMCEALVGFARSTDTQLIAEGVETEADLSALRALGVTHAQGFLLGRPSTTAPQFAPGAVPTPERPRASR